MNNIFLAGEKIDLCIPEEADFAEWASWFNDQNVTRFLEQGKYPNTIQDQRDFYESAISEGRFITLIKSKSGRLLGVISLSNINYEKKSCQIALVSPVASREAILAPLEAMAICTQHAFVRLGVECVWAGQAYTGLIRWIQKLELLGYQVNGIFPDEFRHGLVISDGVRTSITKQRFLSLYGRRGNSLWPGEEMMRKMIAGLRNAEPLVEKISSIVKSLHYEHEQLIDKIERDVD